MTNKQKFWVTVCSIGYLWVTYWVINTPGTGDLGKLLVAPLAFIVFNVFWCFVGWLLTGDLP